MRSTFTWVMIMLMVELAAAQRKAQRLTNIVTPNPIVIGEPVEVTCSLRSIGGVNSLPGIGVERIVNTIKLYQKHTDNTKSHLATYNALNWAYFKIFPNGVIFPKGVTTKSFTMAGGYHAKNADITMHENNVDRVHLTMKVDAAGYDLVTAYVCEFEYITGNRNSMKIAKKFFTETTSENSRYPGGKPGPWKTEPALKKRYIDLRRPGKPGGGNQQACQNLNAFLPEPKSKRENDFLAQLTTKPFRLGMRHKQYPNGNHVWLWDKSGAGVAWHNWIGKRRIPLHADRRCAAMVHDKENWGWIDVACDSKNGTDTVVCEKEPEDWNARRGGLDFAAARADGKLQPPAMLISVALGLCRLIHYM